jgi:hypothetical protein
VRSAVRSWGWALRKWLRSIRLASLTRMRSASPVPSRPLFSSAAKAASRGVMFYTLCHVVDSFVGRGKNAPMKSPAGMACPCFDARLCRPLRFGQHSRAKPTAKEFTEEMLH